MQAITIDQLDVQGFAPRQAEVLKCTVAGLSAKETARALNISHRTVESVLTHLMQRLGARNRVQLVIQAVGAGMLAVRDAAATSSLMLLLTFTSLPSPDADAPDWNRLQARPVRVRTRREDSLDPLLPQAV